MRLSIVFETIQSGDKSQPFIVDKFANLADISRVLGNVPMFFVSTDVEQDSIVIRTDKNGKSKIKQHNSVVLSHNGDMLSEYLINNTDQWVIMITNTSRFTFSAIE